jgi:hypothetical protein
MGPRSDNRGYSEHGGEPDRAVWLASVGPRSDNRGYGRHWLPQFGSKVHKLLLRRRVKEIPAEIERETAASREVRPPVAPDAM